MDAPNASNTHVPKQRAANSKDELREGITNSLGGQARGQSASITHLTNRLAGDFLFFSLSNCDIARLSSAAARSRSSLTRRITMMASSIVNTARLPINVARNVEGNMDSAARTRSPWFFSYLRFASRPGSETYCA